MRTNIRQILAKKEKKEPIVFVTAYDAWMAQMVDEYVDCILVGDSMGMVVQGFDTTLPVTMDEMIYHSRMVARGSSRAFIVADLPFLTYQSSISEAIQSAGRCLKEGGAQAVKLEGGTAVIPHIEAIVSYGIPVMGHLGLTPQSIHAFGGFQKRAKTDEEAERLIADAKKLEEAGAFSMVLENIPHDLAKVVSEAVNVPTIGIGAGPDCDGQVQVFHDLLGFFPDFTPRHAVQFMDGGKQIQRAIKEYAATVRKGELNSK